MHVEIDGRIKEVCHNCQWLDFCKDCGHLRCGWMNTQQTEETRPEGCPWKQEDITRGYDRFPNLKDA